MRLTLRTLLAHLCGLLEPEDARDLEAKVNESPKGKELAERIPMIVSQPDLDAPRLQSKTAGSDPNRVSEYLDGLLSPEMTAQFDRGALKSDRQLAEVASCFEILSVAHQSSRRVSDQTRQRVYRLGSLNIADEGDSFDAERPASHQAEEGATARRELTAQERAAILEEYVDAPVLKPARPNQPSEQESNEPSARSKQPKTKKRSSSNQSASIAPPVPQESDASKKEKALVPKPSDEGSSPDVESENWFDDDETTALVEKAHAQGVGIPEPANEPMVEEAPIIDTGSSSRARWDEEADDSSPMDEHSELDESDPPPRSLEIPAYRPSRGSHASTDAIEAEDESEAPPVEEAVSAPPIEDGSAGEESGDEPVIDDSSTVSKKDSDQREGLPKRRKWIPFAAVGTVAALVVVALALTTDLGSQFQSLLGNGSELASNDSDTSESESTDDESSSDGEQGNEESQSTASQNGEGVEASRDMGLDPPNSRDDIIERDLLGGGAGAPGNVPSGGVASGDQTDGDSGVLRLPGGDNSSGDNNDELTADEILNNAGGAAAGEMAENGDPTNGRPIGHLADPRQLLGRMDIDRTGFQRLLGDTPILAQDQLLSFPSYRPEFGHGEDLIVTMIGATGIELAGATEGVPNIVLRFGRVTVATNQKASTECLLEAGGVVGKATFADSDSAVAIRTIFYQSPGRDPIANSPQRIVDVLSVRGRVIWEDQSKIEVLEAGQAKRYIDGVSSEITTLTSIPYWVSDAPEGIDLTGSEAVSEAVDPTQTIDRTMKLLKDDSHVEIRMLAIQCLSLLGDQQPIVESLREDRNKSYWADQIEWLRSIASRGPVFAQALQDTMNRVYGDSGERAFRLIVGYSEEQLVSGGAEEIVSLLDSADLPVRVLAIDNLLHITGTRGMYRPETPETIRRSHVRTWRRRLEEGEIQYGAVPSPPSLNGMRAGE